MKLSSLKLLDVPTPTPQELAIKHSIPLSRINAALERGIEVELEHTTKRAVAREIALDHLNEDPDYYEKLAAAEKK